MKTLVRAARKLHFNVRIENCSSTKQLFSVSRRPPGKSKTTPPPSDIPRSALPDRFCMFFSQKIHNIWQDLDAHPSEPATFSAYDGPKLFSSLSQKTRFVNSLLNRLPKPACWIPSLLLSLKNAFPLYCLYGTIPPKFKQTVVTPLLKKPGLDPNDFKHFRPVSNQAFVSKRDSSQKTICLK